MLGKKMKRNRFAQGDGSPHIFGPSVNEVWSKYGKEVLLCRGFGDGFECIYVNELRSINFNDLDGFHEIFKYVRSVDQDTADAIIKKYQQDLFARELSIAS